LVDVYLEKLAEEFAQSPRGVSSGAAWSGSDYTLSCSILGYRIAEFGFDNVLAAAPIILLMTIFTGSVTSKIPISLTAARYRKWILPS